MKIKITSLTLIFIGFLLLSLSLTTCSSVHIKTAPEYKGVDPRVINLVNEYKALAKIQGITFKKEVTVGFKIINDGNAVGLTTYGDGGWREIDVDAGFWATSDAITHIVLLFHELTHAYCGRGHTYGNAIPYKEADEIEKDLKKGKLDLTKGYYKDYCPLSMMYPIIVPKDCVTNHYSDYVIELFNHCVPF